MRTQLLWLVMFAAWCVLYSEPSACGADYNQELLFVLNGMKKERSVLKSGVCRMTGRTIFKSLGNSNEDMEGELSILSAFDGRGRIRFDRTLPGWVPDVATIKTDPQHPGVITDLGMKKGILSQKYYRNMKRTGHWRVGSSVIELSADDKRLPLTLVDYFDVKALGLYYWLALRRGLNFDEMIDSCKKMKTLTNVDKFDPNTWSITWAFTNDVATNEWKMWVDVKHGFTPVRYENRERIMKMQDSWWTIQTYNTKWSQKEGLWVPVHHEIMRRPNLSKWRQDISFDVAWESINQPISDDVFDYKGFGAPDTVSVVDASLSQPVVIKSSVTPPTIVERTRTNRGYRNIILFSISLAILIIVVLYFVFRHRKRTGDVTSIRDQES